MDKQSRKRFPEQCLFMNAKGEIMSIEYGKSGFRRFELSTENKIANREIINSYNKRHGVTPEQVKMMHRSALLGWDGIEPTEQEKSGVKKGRVFEVEIIAEELFSQEEVGAIAQTLAGECYDDKPNDKRLVAEVILSRSTAKMILHILRATAPIAVR